MAKKNKNNYEEVLDRLDSIEEKLDELELCSVPKSKETSEEVEEENKETEKGPWEKKLSKLL